MGLSNLKFYHYAELTSTMDAAFELLNSGENCVVVTADWQSSGRGRNGKIWESEKKSNLLFTFALRHSAKKLPIYLLQVIGSIATYKSLTRYINKNNLRLKYPNDVYVLDLKNHQISLDTNKPCFNTNYKKIAGIISETNYTNTDTCCSAIGIGININKPPQVENFSNSTALCEHISQKIKLSIPEIAEDLANHIILLLKQPAILIKQEWISLLNIFEKKIYLKDNSTQILSNKVYYVRNILDDCRLELVDPNENIKIINNGDTIRYEL